MGGKPIAAGSYVSECWCVGAAHLLSLSERTRRLLPSMASWPDANAVSQLDDWVGCFFSWLAVFETRSTFPPCQ